MRFESPIFLIFLLILPLLIQRTRKLNKKKRLSSASIIYSDIKIFRRIPISKNIKYRNKLVFFRIIALILLTLAMARPQWGKITEDIHTEGIDIILAIDVSGSMRAEDFKPNNRLYAAKKVAENFIRGRRNDRLGMIIFAAASFTQVPLTLDYGILLSFLNKIKLDMLPDGTAIGMAIVNATNRLRESKAKSKVIILLTDGVNTAGKVDPVTSAKASSTLGIRIYTIGMGKKGGAPIPTYNPLRGKTYLRDSRTGKVLLTKLDEKTLEKIARLTGGRYYRATNKEKLEKIFEEISKMEKSKIGAKNYMRYRELFPPLVWLAVLLLLFEFSLSNTILRKIP